MISVITITHNRSEFLTRAIRSVLDQDFHDFEYIIIDDGSDEDIETLIKTFNDPRIIYVYTKRLARISALRNLGLEKAKGQIISFLDNDDFWEPSYLRQVNSKFSAPEIKAVISNAIISKGEKKEVLFNDLKNLKVSGNLLEQKLKNDQFVIHPSCFSFRNSLNLRSNAELKYGDNDLFLRILANGNSLIIQEELVTIIKHQTNMSSQATYDSTFIQAYFEELENP